jgi:hypothetical protein
MDIHTTRKHRPRSRPTPSGKRNAITDNDLHGIFEPLSRYAQLTTKQLVAFDQRYASKTRNRLTDLYHEGGGWLTRLSEDVRFANHLFMDELYALGDDAEQLLETRGLIPPELWMRATRIGGHATIPSRIIRLAHDHMACDIALDIEIGARRAGAAFRSHVTLLQNAPEITRRRSSPLRIPVSGIPGAPKWIEPDALFAIGERVYALETDRGTESLEKIIRAKVLAYRAIVADRIIDEHLAIDNLTVLFVTLNETRRTNMMALIKSIARHGKTPMFALRTRIDLEDFARSPAPTGAMFDGAWSRVGFPDLHLGLT